jgi:putative FmdB family regulatory protein
MVKFVCYECKTMFELPDSPPEDATQASRCRLVRCPSCESAKIVELPAWIPLGFNLDYYFAPTEWEYKCKQCTKVFKLPVPSGKKEENERKCPACGSTDIERLTTLVAEPQFYCG